jgi:hypothetical protein
MSLPTKYKSINIGSASLKFICEPCEGEYLDTKVKINDGYLCMISWPDLDSFIEDLQQAVAKHSI